MWKWVKQLLNIFQILFTAILQLVPCYFSPELLQRPFKHHLILFPPLHFIPPSLTLRALIYSPHCFQIALLIKIKFSKWLFPCLKSIGFKSKRILLTLTIKHRVFCLFFFLTLVRSEAPRGLVRSVSLSAGLGWGLRICISNSLSGDTDATSWGKALRILN